MKQLNCIYFNITGRHPDITFVILLLLKPHLNISNFRSMDRTAVFINMLFTFAQTNVAASERGCYWFLFSKVLCNCSISELLQMEQFQNSEYL